MWTHHNGKCCNGVCLLSLIGKAIIRESNDGAEDKVEKTKKIMYVKYPFIPIHRTEKIEMKYYLNPTLMWLLAGRVIFYKRKYDELARTENI